VATTTDPTLRVVTPDAPDPDEALLAQLRLDPTQAQAAAKVPLTLAVTKPKRHEFIRVHPHLSLDVAAIEIKDDSAFYVVAPHLQQTLQAETSSFVLRPYILRSGDVKLWPIRLGSADGKTNEWHRSAHAVAALAVKQWLRVTANTVQGIYEPFVALQQPKEPEWPEQLSLAAMMKLAFVDRDRLINSPDHHVLKSLQGRL
jgi:hypothetical protein